MSAKNFPTIISSQLGQGILEVIVTIGIGTILIFALVVLSIRTNRSSDFSKASSQASSLASEGIEYLKQSVSSDLANAGNQLLQYKNCDGSVPVTNPPLTAVGFGSWSQFWQIDVDEAGPCLNTYGRDGVFHAPNSASSPKDPFQLHFTPGDNYPSDFNIVLDNRTFTRVVYVADTPPSLNGKSNCNTDNVADPNYGIDYKTIKQFTVDVSWTDTTGTHHQTQSTCIQK